MFAKDRLTSEQLNDLNEIRKEFAEKRLIYSPNSIRHGHMIHENSSQDRAINNDIHIGRLTDFIEFLFEKSEHCDHISQRDAWDEFEQYEYKQTLIKK